MARMCSRERLITTLNHREPDRVPIDIGGILSTGFNRIAHNKFKKYLAMSGGKTEIVHMMQQEVRPDVRIRNLFGCDTYGIWPNIIGVKKSGSDNYIDEWGVQYKRYKPGYYYSMVGHPLKNAQIKDLEQYKWPNPYDSDRTQGLAQKANDLYAHTNLALIACGTFSSGPFHHCAWLLGIEDFMLKLLLDHEFCIVILEKVLEFHLGYWDSMLNAVGKYVQLAVIGDDLGANDAPLISPDLYRKLIKPYHKRLISFIKEKFGIKVLLHTDGNVYPLIPDLIEIGVDALNPIQYTAKDMDTKKLKMEFGKKLTFWGGGCDVQRILPFATPEEVEFEVKQRIKELAPGGGFVFAPTHNIQPDVPVENVKALYSTALKYGTYSS